MKENENSPVTKNEETQKTENKEDDWFKDLFVFLYESYGDI